MEKARVWKEKVVIPTYEIGEAEKTPFFLKSGYIRAAPVRCIPIRL